MDARLRRVNKEIADCKNDRTSNITIELIDDSPFHLKGSFPGPEDTPYEGGHYEVDIVIPDSYPFQPVKMKFITKVYHPNVSSASGAICLDILKDAWSPVLTLKSTLISLQSLLCSPEPSDPQDAEVAKHYTTSRTSFDDTARYWAEIYAGAPPRPGSKPGQKPVAVGKGGKIQPPIRDEIAMAGLERAHVEQFEALGFERTKVIDVLRRLNYRGANVPNTSEDRVVEELLNMNTMDIQTTRETIFKLSEERNKTLHSLPTLASPEALQAALESLPSVLPETGLGPKGALDVVLRDVVPGLAAGHAGPRYFGLITGGSLPSAELADILTTIYDQNAGVNRPKESITGVVESLALELMVDLLRLPREKFPARIITTGATAANVLGLAVARDHAVRIALGSKTHSVAEDGFGGITVKVYTDRPHASIMKASAIVGIGRANVIDLGKKTRNGVIGMDLFELEQKLKENSPGSGSAAIVSLSFGEVNTGDFTPDVAKIRKLCDQYSVWLHIDAAFGAYARLVPDIVGSLAEGLELGDSISCDAHKWLNVPYDSGLFFSRSIEHQTSVFGFSPSKAPPAYLVRAENPNDSSPTPEMEAAVRIPDPMSLSLEFSRRFRALPIYTALLDQGRAGYADIVRRNILFARKIAHWMVSPEGKSYYEVLNLRQSPALDGSSAEPTTPLNILFFWGAATNPVTAYRGAPGASLLVEAINRTRKMFVTPGPGGVRIAVSNWCTGLSPAHGDGAENDFDIVVDVLLSVVEDPAL